MGALQEDLSPGVIEHLGGGAPQVVPGACLGVFARLLFAPLGLDALEGPKNLLKPVAAGPGRFVWTDPAVSPGSMKPFKLADEALRRRPELKVLFTTGYTRNAVVHNGVLDPGVELIGKPFTVDQLAAKVRAILDA